MKTLEFNQMENIQGSNNAVACGIAIGLLFTPAAFWGAVGLAFCVTGDSSQHLEVSEQISLTSKF